MRPYFEKMQDWGKPAKENAANAEEIRKVEQEIAELVEKAKNAGMSKDVLNKRGEWTVHQRLEYILDPGTWAPLYGNVPAYGGFGSGVSRNAAEGCC